LDARDELARAERLRHVVVGAELEPADLLVLESPGGEDDDRQVRLAPEILQDREAVAPGKREIEHDEIGPLGADEAQRLLPIRGPAAEELVEDALAVLARDPGAVVADLDADGLADPAGRYPDRRAVRRVADGVHDEVREGLRDPAAVADDARRATVEIEPDP